MRSFLLNSCLLALIFSIVGCDAAMKKEDAAQPAAPVVAPADSPKGGMDGPAPEVKKPEGSGSMTPAPAPDAPKKDDMPK